MLISSASYLQAQPSGHWLGYLRIRPKTYKIYLDHSSGNSKVFVLNPKANEIPLDTFFIRNDSLFFSRSDFYSTYNGRIDQKTNAIHGHWTDDDHKKHTMTFNPVDPDTLAGLQPRTSVYQWKKPKEKSDGIKVSSPNDQNINKVMLDSLMANIIDEKYPNIHSILIARNSQLVFEEYFYGWTGEDLWLIQSATKSFTSALTGIALMKGEIKSLENSLCSYIPQYRTKICNVQNGSITLNQLLSMTTGLEWNELEFDYYDPRNSNRQCWEKPDPFDCLFSRPRTNAQGQTFAYNSLNHLLMNKVLRKATRIENRAELNDRLLRPMDITRVNTGKEEHGVIGDISLVPRDMMKFGLLYLNKGSWNGKQIVPEKWVETSTEKKIDLGNGDGYGYFWWTKEFNVDDEKIDCYYAWGYGGQYIFIIPQLSLVTVMTASNWVMDEKKIAFEMMENFVLPACR